MMLLQQMTAPDQVIEMVQRRITCKTTISTGMPQTPAQIKSFTPTIMLARTIARNCLDTKTSIDHGSQPIRE